MANGTITLKRTGSVTGNLYGQIVWSGVSNDSVSNKSTVQASIQLKRNSGYKTTGTWKGSLVIGDTTKAISYYGTIGSSWVTVGTLTATVAHNEDGTGSCRIYGKINGPSGTSCEGVYVSGEETITLDTIPRASSISAASAVTLGNKCSVKWTPHSADFRYKLKFEIGDWSYLTGAIHPNTTNEYTYTGYTIPLEAANQIPNAVSGTMSVYLYTYSDSSATTQIGSAYGGSFAVTVPNNAQTQAAVTMSLTPVHTLPAAFSGLYVQGKSKLKATLSATGKYGATIKSYSMKVDSATYDADDGYTSGYLTGTGSFTVYGYATDSRGYTGSTSKTITVIPYSKPKITVSVCGRCDANGNLSDSGTYLKIKASRNYSPVKSGETQRNFCQIQYRYKAAAAAAYSGWTTILTGSDLSTNEVETAAMLGGVLAVDTTYQVQIRAVDDIGEYGDTLINVPTDVVHNHKTKNGWGFGKYCEGENLLDVAWDAHFHGEVLIGDTGMTLKEYILAVISEGG